MNSIQPISNTTAIAPKATSTAAAVSDPVVRPNAPQFGRSSAADVPSSIAGLALFSASAATDTDMAATQGGYGIPDQDGDNDGK